MFRLKIPTLCLLSALLIVTCKKKAETPEPEPVPAPVPSPLPGIITGAVFNITDSTASCTSTVTSEGESALTAVGVCWDTLSAPTTLRSHVTAGAGIGTFTSKMTGLKLYKKYFVRAYASNSKGTAYGNEVSFSMASPPAWTKSALTATFQCLINDGVNIYAGTTNGVIFSSDTGNTWKNIGLQGMSVESIIRDNTALFVISESVGKYTLYRSTDDGNSWTSLNSKFPYTVGIYAVQKGKTKLVVQTDSNAFVSSDNGDTWINASAGLSNPDDFSGKGGMTAPLVATDNYVYGVNVEFSSFDFQQNMRRYEEAGNYWTSHGITMSKYEYASSAVGCGSKIFLTIDKSHVVFDELTEQTYQLNLPANTYLQFHGDKNILVCTDHNEFVAISRDKGITWNRVKAPSHAAWDLPSPIYRAFATTHYIWVNTGKGLFRIRI